MPVVLNYFGGGSANECSKFCVDKGENSDVLALGDVLFLVQMPGQFLEVGS